jgi:UDP-galactopyranose mutase
MNNYNQYQIIIIGAGISGAVLAERYANILNKKVLIIDKRDHIGGNCYDFVNKTGIRISKYGPHYFRTNNQMVYEYINKFSNWRKFEPKCLSHVDDMKVPIPVNIKTVNLIFGTKITTEQQMRDWLNIETEKISNPANSEESALKRVGKRLYEKMFKSYTIKQWDKHPKDLDPSVMDRIPIRTNFDDRYFTETYQLYPTEGYTKVFENMLSSTNIQVMLNTDWNTIKEKFINVEKIFFTGKIDSYFDERLGKLEYRSLRFEEETLDLEFFQDEVQENYPSLAVDFTRIVEYKHQSGQINSKTTIVKEYPTWTGEPYYPVPTKRNAEIYSFYQKKAELLQKHNIYFVGRLANYKYFNMDQAFLNSLDLFSKLEHENISKIL